MILHSLNISRLATIIITGLSLCNYLYSPGKKPAPFASTLRINYRRLSRVKGVHPSSQHLNEVSKTVTYSIVDILTKKKSVHTILATETLDNGRYYLSLLQRGALEPTIEFISQILEKLDMYCGYSGQRLDRVTQKSPTSACYSEYGIPSPNAPVVGMHGNLSKFNPGATIYTVVSSCRSGRFAEVIQASTQGNRDIPTSDTIFEACLENCQCEKLVQPVCSCVDNGDFRMEKFLKLLPEERPQRSWNLPFAHR